MKGFRLLVSGLFFLSALFLHAQGDSENAPCGQVSNVQIVELQSVYVHLTWDCEYTDATFHIFITNTSGDTVDRDDDNWIVPEFWTGLLEPSTIYNYSVSVICSEDNIGEPVTGQFTTRPCDTVFSNVKAEAGPTYVDITWDDFPVDEGQDIYIYHDTHVFITDMWGDTVVQSRYAITPFSWGYLDVNTTYGYGVAVRCSPNVTAKPVTGTFTTGPCPPVSNVDVHVGIDQVQFFWDAGGIKTKYPARLIITHIDGDTVWKYPTTKAGKIIDHLQANTIYQYSLSSSCGHDSLSEPVIGTFTTHPCPTVFNVEVNARMTDAYITWENTEHSSLTHVMITNVAGDTIMEGEFDDFNAFNEFSSSFQLEPNTTYLYSIIARCLSGDSEPVTGEFTTLPCGQVSNVQTEVGVTDVKLSWSVESGVYGYHMTLTEANGGVIFSNPDYYADSIEVSQLKPNTTYTCSILLRCTEAISGEPYTGQFTTLSQPDCGQVSNVSVNAGVNDVTLNWEAPQTEHIGYHVTLSENKPFAGGSDPIVSRDVSDTYFSYSSLHPNTNYVYNISVKCDWGSGSPVKGSFKTLNDVGNAVEKDAFSTQIYPNPNTGEAIVETMEDIHMEVFTSSGLLLETSDLSAGKHTVRFSSKGVFMVRFSNPSRTAVRRIIVL